LASLIYSTRAYADLDRFVSFASEHGLAPETVIRVIAEAIAILEHHPFVGRHAEHDLRELVISHGKSGFVALYDYYPSDDLVVILALRHQREAGYKEAPSPPPPRKSPRKRRS
jgi:plasmid stabilization system protein ParE